MHSIFPLHPKWQSNSGRTYRITSEDSICQRGIIFLSHYLRFKAIELSCRIQCSTRFFHCVSTYFSLWPLLRNLLDTSFPNCSSPSWNFNTTNILYIYVFHVPFIYAGSIKDKIFHQWNQFPLPLEWYSPC